MPQMKTKSAPTPQPIPSATLTNGPATEVLTLGEAAAYLRLPEQDVMRLVQEQDLPARQAGAEWRFLKSAIQVWLATPQPKAQKQGIWAMAGVLKDDPHREEMLQDIYRKRGRPMTEEE